MESNLEQSSEIVVQVDHDFQTFSQNWGSSMSRASSPFSEVITKEAFAKLEPAMDGLDEYWINLELEARISSMS